MKNTYKSILQSYCECSSPTKTIASDAQLFALLRQLAYASGDLPAVSDVDNAFLQAVEKCRAERGDDEARRFMAIYDYSNAGATLGCDFAHAMSDGDTMFAQSIYTRALGVSEQLSEKRELRDAFSALFRQFSAVS